MIRKQIYFFGRVQGVGFRYTTNNIAKQFAVNGFVRNRPNGSVELIVEGSENETERFLETIRLHFEDFIDDETIEAFPATGEFSRFEIR